MEKKTLSSKQFRTAKVVTAVILALAVSQAVVFKEYLVAAAAVALAFVAMVFLKGRVGDVLADERDYEVGGRSALLAMQIFGQAGVLGMFLFLALAERNPAWEAVAYTLAYAVMLLMILYVLIFRFYNRVKFFEKKVLYLIFILMLFSAAFLACLKIWSL